MSVNVNESYVTVFMRNFSCRYNVLLTEVQHLEHTTRTGVQDHSQGLVHPFLQCQGRPRATRMHCEQMGCVGLAHH